ncbi:hypothetical protein TrCOL_g3875 [Triparma columacea]|uniref:LOV domain-containing protein n=1 Tax=Triparma columacea TaxID=722753 RepID=A0A9W7GH02_9STRA|nr:hypothetical protein TrCOL_g3875 [Triparma columacea]
MRPLFAPSKTAKEDIDLTSIFSDYFLEDWTDTAADMPQTGAPVAAASGASAAANPVPAPRTFTSDLPVGRGITTQWHTSHEASTGVPTMLNLPYVGRGRIFGLEQPYTLGYQQPPIQVPGMTSMQRQQPPQQQYVPSNNNPYPYNNPYPANMSRHPPPAATASASSSTSSSKKRRAADVGLPAAPSPTSDEDSSKKAVAERRLRNREHAKRSRVRKKFLLESLQEEVRGLQEENKNLRLQIQKSLPSKAPKILQECCGNNELFDDLPTNQKGKERPEAVLDESDFNLIASLNMGQQNFVLSDPRLPDNPIVFASPGFFNLTGYTREQVLGRNCRFLQGPGTDPAAVEVIRKAVETGNDASVCLLNYRSDGTPFWNQFFVAALRDEKNEIVNYVGVQCPIQPADSMEKLERKVNQVLPLINK